MRGTYMAGDVGRAAVLCAQRRREMEGPRIARWGNHRVRWAKTTISIGGQAVLTFTSELAESSNGHKWMPKSWRGVSKVGVDIVMLWSVSAVGRGY